MISNQLCVKKEAWNTKQSLLVITEVKGLNKLGLSCANKVRKSAVDCRLGDCRLDAGYAGYSRFFS